LTLIFEHVHRPKKPKVKTIFKNIGQKRYSEVVVLVWGREGMKGWDKAIVRSSGTFGGFDKQGV
jgi:hypothetical protein